MSGTTASTATVGSFVAGDYAVFGLMLLGSAAIGVYYAWKDRGAQGTSGDFLMGGRSLTALPVSLSLTASFMSAITVLASPAEVYRFGATFSLVGLSYAFTVFITSEVYLPVFYRLGITSTYEYLELRFNRVTRLLGTVFFIVQTILYTGIVIYTPALALNQVTGMDLWPAVISTGVVCTFYCTMGGLKAVVWTDVFQVGIMLAGFLCVIIRSVILQGGVQTIMTDSQLGGRLNFWDFDVNPLRRHTFWTMVCGGTFVWVSVYGINQAQVQRYISCKSITHARTALFMNLIGLWAIMLCSVFAGLCLYSVYKNCDPWTSGQISAPDQLMPFLVMDILRDFPGLPGLFVAAAFSGSLSTVSSSINALAAVTIEDLIKPHTQMSERHLSWISKGLTFTYGGVCIGMAGLASLMGGSVIQTVTSIFGIIGGPLLGLFSLGILCPFANSTGALTGVMSGLAVSLWVGIGAQVYPPSAEMTRPLSLSTQGCSFNVTADSFNVSTATLPALLMFNTTTASQDDVAVRPVLAESWYSLSYLYFSPIGTITAIVVGLVVSLLTGGTKLKLESGLTLMKEDMYSYHLLKRLVERATRQTRDDATRNGQRKLGNDNPGFRDIELDFANGNVPT